MRCGFSESCLEFHPELRCETSPLLLQLGSSSGALGGSRSLKQIGRCHGQIRMPLKPLFILVLQKVKKKNPGAVCQEYPSSSSRAHHFLPFRAGDIENICLQTRREEDSPLSSLPPEDLRVSLLLRFLFPFSLGCLSTAILIQLCRSGSTESNSSSHPERPGTSPPVPALPRPFGHGGPSCHTQFGRGREDADTNLIFIRNPVLHELSDLLFLMAMRCTVTLPLGLGN